MSDAPVKITQTHRKRRWWVRLLRGVGWSVLLLLLLHRPLVHYGGRWVAIRVARAQNVELDFSIRGNLWSGVELRDVRAKRLATGPAPIERLTLNRAAVGYSAWPLLRGDLKGLERIEIGTLDIELRPVESQKAHTPQKPIAEQLRSLLARPLPAPLISVTRADVRVIAKDEEVVVKNFRLLLSPATTGYVGWDAVELPRLEPLAAFRADTQFSAGKLLVRERGEIVLDVTATKTDASATLNVLGSKITARVTPQPTGDLMDAQLRVDSLDANSFARVAKITLPVPAAVPNFALAFSGAPETPATWSADVKANITSAAAGEIPAATLRLHASLKDLVATMSELNAESAGAVLRAKGGLPLGGLFTKADASNLANGGAVEFDFSVADLATIAKPLSGNVVGKGTASVANGELSVSATVNADNLAADAATVAKTVTIFTAKLPMKPAASLRDVVADAEIVATEIGVSSARVDRAQVRASLRALRVDVSELRIERGPSVIAASAFAMLDERGKPATAPEAKFSINVPALSDFQIAPNGKPLNGTIAGSGNITLGEPVTESKGSVSIHGKGLKFGDADAGQFDIEAVIENGAVTAKQFTVQLPGSASIVAQGRGSLAAPYAFTGQLAAKLPDLSAFSPLLAVFGEKRSLAGTVTLDVDGKGDPGKPEAVVKLDAKRVKFDKLKINEARFNARVSMTDAEISELFVANDQLRASAKAVWKDGRANISDLAVTLDGQPVLSGTLSAPFTPTAAEPLPGGEPISAKLLARELDVAKLLASLGQPATAAGKISTTIEATGTLKNPQLVVVANGDGLRAAAAGDIPPTSFDTRVTFSGNELAVAGTIKQPLVQPVKFSGSTTIEFASVVAGKIPPLAAIPLKISVDIPSSSLEFLPRYVPAISKIDGTLGVAMRVSGSAAKPVIEGTTTVDVKLARFADSAIPVLTGFKARIAASGDRISFTEFGGEAGGGHFAVTGSVGLADPAQPVFDLALKSKDVLVLRDDSALVRAEADVALRGPLNSATASGTVYIVQSRFNKEIEILPLSLPGKPQPVPAVVAKRKTISFPNPPLRDWTFNIAVKTRAEDPFLVRGNLAKGKVAVDVRLAGTGRVPYLSGSATIEQFSATLPLSTLTTRRGLVIFSENSPFEPSIELEAESKIRQYTVIMRLDGPASKPRLELESEPPLPQREILSLLTTGSLSGEIGSNNTAMATRAAVLVIKGWYKKLFKRDFPLGGDGEGDSLFDRFEVDFGAVDPKTGRNETTAQFRVTERLFFIGDLQLGGGFEGRVKYLFRFR
jgi:hypothetical protein